MVVQTEQERRGPDSRIHGQLKPLETEKNGVNISFF